MTPVASLEERWAIVRDPPVFYRAAGPSADHTLTIDEMADSLAAFLDVVGAERTTLLGNSLGCGILAAFARRHPDRIERAILVSAAG